ncbi:hypothetical protein ACFQY8_01600 [Alloscardovia venturai]|uniref:Uncharacterized protein n=1 Tax=Alloscardovia venturai TaxID=1769421 RepID=A0ABW2Y8Q7_9BIFI
MTKNQSVLTAGIVGAAATALMCFVIFFIALIGQSDFVPWITAAIVLAVAGAFVLLYPAEIYTRTAGVSRIFGFATALASIIAALVTRSLERLGIAILMLMFISIAGGFLFEMLRKERVELIKSLSQIVFMSFAGLCASGWIILVQAVVLVAYHMAIVGGIVVGVLVCALFIMLTCALARGAGDSATKGTSMSASVWGYMFAVPVFSGIFPLIMVLVCALMENLR